MRIGAMIELEKPLDQVVADVSELARLGFKSAWASQIFGYDALTLLALVGTHVAGIELGTGVVPVYSRHPQALAQQALTAQAATDNRIVLGVGLSHQVVVEGLWGYSYERPARYMREYLSALMPMLNKEAVSFSGEVVTANTYGPLDVPGAEPPEVLVAALGPAMLKTAGTMTSGTVTWMTGIQTVASHIVPTIEAAAREAGSRQPRICVALPVCVTSDAAKARERIDRAFSIYPNLPSYRAMLDREGAESASEIAIVGDEAAVRSGVASLKSAGATDLVASIVGNAAESNETRALLASLQSG
ncbi:MAG: TIGR03564 family F420-dependent LLM class oxidoreductase [Actinobacteria bacterium]|nr:TIGR03564 family F420-dependent LLM class oxidoreductase [Actinomycetota bacterium]MCL5444959.1 TIGR03564 family F420-dependent LLM class oxidoreductase [Actinomycetota bacterium]